MKTGDAKQAQLYYEKVLELDPGSGKAREMLKKLKKGIWNQNQVNWNGAGVKKCTKNYWAPNHWKPKVKSFWTTTMME